MENNEQNNTSFSKVWIGGLVFLLVLCVIGVYNSSKGTYSTSNLCISEQPAGANCVAVEDGMVCTKTFDSVASATNEGYSDCLNLDEETGFVNCTKSIDKYYECTCQSGTYYDTNSQSCANCPPGQSSDPGAVGSTECYELVICDEGTFYQGSTSFCKICEADSYCKGTTVPKTTEYNNVDVGMEKCPGNSTSKPGSTSKSDCKISCPKGFYYNGSGGCNECKAGSYCPADVEVSVTDTDEVGMEPCDDDEWSPSGAWKKEQCYRAAYCEPGEYYYDLTKDCYECPENSYCPGGRFEVDKLEEGIEECPGISVSKAGATSIADCKISCEAGYYYHGLNNTCDVCPEGYFCLGTEVVHDYDFDAGLDNKCDDGYTSDPGAKEESDCYLDEGDETDSEEACYYEENHGYYEWLSPSDVSLGVYDPRPQYDTPEKCAAANNSSGGGTENTYTATFNANGGTLNGSSTKSCTTTDSSCSVSGLPTVSKSGYTFEGWGTSSTCQSGSTDRLSLSDDTTFYACLVEDEVPGDNGGEENVEDNPGTGSVAIFMAWIVGLATLIYAFWYFKSTRKIEG